MNVKMVFPLFTSRFQGKIHHPSLVLRVEFQCIIYNNLCLLEVYTYKRIEGKIF